MSSAPDAAHCFFKLKNQIAGCAAEVASMEYIEFGKTGMRTSRFGLGCMRLPAENEKSTEIIRYAIDHGVNYLDTAWMYPGS